jgi:hypothetical protein
MGMAAFIAAQIREAHLKGIPTSERRGPPGVVNELRRFAYDRVGSESVLCIEADRPFVVEGFV